MMRSSEKYMRPRILSFIAITIILLTACDPFSKDKMDFYSSAKSVDLSEENVKSISLSSNEKEIMNIFGSPNEVTEIENAKYLTYDGIEFGVIKQQVNRYYFNRKFQTAKKIKIGDAAENVQHSYGEDYYERFEQGARIIGYFDKEKNMNIEFICYENKVTGVILERVR
ncbi:hypothetical protein [Mesobacillus sp. S13]|uniref:hypothetical protein n=1 Tax=Mesobacillus sp. S13 TaxID=2880221 RepID=UPI001CF5CF8F|nr:hypothetical protein [Mesobacillus sp. S13]